MVLEAICHYCEMFGVCAWLEAKARNCVQVCGHYETSVQAVNKALTFYYSVTWLKKQFSRLGLKKRRKDPPLVLVRRLIGVKTVCF